MTEISKNILDGGQFNVDTNYYGIESPLQVNLVSSAAGGTGSGIFLDILVLVAKILRENDVCGQVHPWIILPDIYRCMAPTPATALVYSNAYGLIRELDYLYHLKKDNQEPIDFIFDEVYYLDEQIGDAYLINNKNECGMVCYHIDQLTASVAHSMFISSISSRSDLHPSIALQYDVNNKEAHYASVGSAEIIYDNQAVGNVIAKGIISQMCNELCYVGLFDALKEVNAWMVSESVSIKGKDADILTDSILPKYAPFSVIIDKDSDLNSVNANIFAGAEADNVIAEARNNEANKLETVKRELVSKINEILNSQNGVGAAKAFLESLLDNIEICMAEINNERNILHSSQMFSIDWECEISCLRTRILKVFKKNAAETLQCRINDYIAHKRDLLRCKLAMKFYADFMTFVEENIARLNEFGERLKAMEIKQRNDIVAIQYYAKNPSQFQIYLHTYEVDNFILPEIAEVSTLFRSKNPIYELVGNSEKELNDVFFNFAKDHNSVLEAVNVSIEQKMSTLSDAQLKEIFTKVKEMSSPLWSTNSYGYLDHAQELTTIFTIGVYDQSAGVIQSKYVDEFTLGSIKPTFATTHQTDRITFFQSQCYSPAYAVNNILDYKREVDENMEFESYPVSYLDEKWNQRMNDEQFDILPRKYITSLIPEWMMAIVYGFIIFDNTINSYIMKLDRDDPRADNLLELGQRRDLAFEQFQLRGLDREVEERIQKMIIEKGRPAVTEVIKNVKSQLRTYVANNAQLSPIELDRIQAKDPDYQLVRDLLEKEVAYLKELEL